MAQRRAVILSCNWVLKTKHKATQLNDFSPLPLRLLITSYESYYINKQQQRDRKLRFIQIISCWFST